METRLKRAPVILLAAAVVIAGTVIAFQFRKPTGSADASATRADATSQPQANVAQPPTTNTAQANTEQTNPTFNGSVEQLNQAPDSTSVASALAELDRKVFPPQATAQGLNSSQNTANSHAPQPRESFTSTKPLVALESEEKTHRIADGDTLMKLAERYLGRADRAVEIFACNRDVLRTPEVLPIGADLRIPPMIPVQTADHATQFSDDPGAGQTRLIPVQPAPATQPSTAASPAVASKGASEKSQKPRTYEVKAGDSLVDIARKLYGDGRKHEQLFAANRNVLKNPAALKPGMVLVVP